MMSKMTETNKLDLNQFNQTPIIKSLSKSKSSENLQKIEVKRGRKSKHANEYTSSIYLLNASIIVFAPFPTNG